MININGIEFTETEWIMVQRLLRIALDFEKDSFQLFSELKNDDADLKEAIMEVVNDEKETELIIELHENKELLNKIESLIIE